MLRSHQYHSSFSRWVHLALPWGTLACAALVAGCSTDISRLERPSYSVGERPPIPSEPMGRRNAGAPPAVDNSGWADSGPRPGAPAPARVDRVTSLPEPAATVNPSHPVDEPRKKTVAAVPAPAKSAKITPGATIEVQSGDSLYAISKRHRVSIAALMELNGLKNATLKPGQKIVLPANAQRPMVKPAAPATAVGQPAAATAPVVATPVHTAPQPMAAAPVGDWNGSYTVKPGDSLYGIARAHKTHVAELQRQNGITDALKMKPGIVLKVPAGSATLPAAAEAPAPAAATTPVATAPAAAPAPASPAGGVRLLNPPADALPTKEATATQPIKVAGPVAAATANALGVKFRWPARGTLLAGFGKRPDGAHNDGINIAVAKGTDIAASDAGTVAYAGSEIKAYGNLILIRHEGGWVTAYAHADQILVKRGDVVTRGQVIAKAGSSGSVDQPQVHFELRQGSKPVDPAPHMEK